MRDIVTMTMKDIRLRFGHRPSLRGAFVRPLTIGILLGATFAAAHTAVRSKP